MEERERQFAMQREMEERKLEEMRKMEEQKESARREMERQRSISYSLSKKVTFVRIISESFFRFSTQEN